MQLAGWQILDAATTQRKRLLQAGYLPVPTEGKKPPIAGWQNLVADEGDINSWFHQYPEAFNTGVLTRTTPAVDVDIHDLDVADAIEALLWEMIGARGMVRFGQPPKRAVLFRTETSFGKISTPVFTSPTQQRHRVEVLCDGQQTVVMGIHPGTGKPYSWHGGQPGDVVRADLLELTEALAREFVTRATEVMRAQGWTEEVRKSNGADHNGGGGEFDAIYGGRERKYALAALQGCADELAADDGSNGGVPLRILST
jgi:Bifunctional DNA primase/polymerase, N-terminal